MKTWLWILLFAVIIGLVFTGIAWLLLEPLRPAIMLVYSFMAYILRGV